MVKLRFKGEGRFLDGDQYRNASINVESGEVFEVSSAKASELLASPDFEAVDPSPRAAEAPIEPAPELPRDPEPMRQAKRTK